MQLMQTTAIARIAALMGAAWRSAMASFKSGNETGREKKAPPASPFEGRCNIGQFSGLRKLARAMRRHKVPNERAAIIGIAEERGKARASVYRHSSWKEAAHV